MTHGNPDGIVSRVAHAGDVAIPLPDGRRVRAALAEPADAAAGGAARPAVLVLHEALGLTDDIRRIARRFADAGYVALAPDFLAGLGPRPLCIARFFRGVGRPGTGRPYRVLDAARAWLAAHDDVDERRIGVAGFCVGGGFAMLWAAGAGQDAVRVAAPFYAAVPANPEAALEGICPVVASYGGRDRVFAPGAPRLAAALSALGVEHEVTVYPDAGHSFMNRHGGLVAGIERRLPTAGGYHEASAEDAWRRVTAFFDRHLGAPAPGSAA